MATWQDVDAVALALPQVELDQTAGSRGWLIAGKHLAWERPLRKKELATELDAGRQPYLGDILAFHLPDLQAKEAYLQNFPNKFFEIPHFSGYRGILCRLSELDIDDLQELLFEAYLCKAPKKLVKQLLESRPDASNNKN
ncbi:MAG: MmcQ/YjbR family DNA-binding protein [Micrococcales bacterium]